MSGGIAALVGVLVLVCAVVAWEWYSHLGKGAAPQPVQQIAAVTPPATPSPSASPTPVTYVPVAQPSPTAPVQAAVSTPAASAPPSGSPQAAPAQAASPTPAPYRANATAIPGEPMVVATLQPNAAIVKPVREAPDAPPRILSMSISTPVAHGGQIVSGTVETTSNVASVEARIAGYTSSMQKIGVGRFALSYRVPNLPFFLHRTYTIEVIARNTRGDAVSSSVPITIR